MSTATMERSLAVRARCGRRPAPLPPLGKRASAKPGHELEQHGSYVHRPECGGSRQESRDRESGGNDTYQKPMRAETMFKRAGRKHGGDEREYRAGHRPKDCRKPLRKVVDDCLGTASREHFGVKRQDKHDEQGRSHFGEQAESDDSAEAQTTIATIHSRNYYALWHMPLATSV